METVYLSATFRASFLFPARQQRKYKIVNLRQEAGKEYLEIVVEPYPYATPSKARQRAYGASHHRLICAAHPALHLAAGLTIIETFISSDAGRRL